MAKKKEGITAAIHVGAAPDTINATGTNILQILEAGFNYSMDQKTIVAAIEGLERVASVNGATVSGCHVEMPQPE